MAEIARNYHDSLQQKGLPSEDIQTEASEHVVLGVIKTQLPAEERSLLEQTLTKQNIEEVLKLLPNGKATGIDGLPYEFWKWLLEKSKHVPKDGQTMNHLTSYTA
jgi:hypothetical protein